MSVTKRIAENEFDYIILQTQTDNHTMIPVAAMPHTKVCRDELIVRAYRSMYGALCGYVAKRIGFLLLSRLAHALQKLSHG